MTWNNRPALISGALDDKGAVSSGTWVEYDVTSMVSGSGEVNLALIATSSDGADLASREATLRPQLVVTFSPVDCMPRRERYTERWFPFADAYVSQASPSSNFGRAPVRSRRPGGAALHPPEGPPTCSTCNSTPELCTNGRWPGTPAPDGQHVGFLS